MPEPDTTPAADPHVYAPFSSEQVTALNRWQHGGPGHPFTCARLHASGRSPVLDATHSGWICPDPDCDFTQDWALTVMANPGAWPTLGAFDRTETGATIANPQAAGAEAGDIERGHLRDQLCEAFIRLIRDHADRSVIAPGYMADAALHVRDQEMQALRDELAENAGVIRALRRQRDTAEETVARVREAAADTIMFGPNASLAVPLSRLRTALTPPADQDRGGQ